GLFFVCMFGWVWLRVSISVLFFFFSSRRRHTRFKCDWSSDVCSSDLIAQACARMLGQSIPHDDGVPHDAAYLTRPLDRADFKRACAVLESIAFVGLAARPRESLLLLWYTFGWPPDKALLLAQTLPDSDSINLT